VVLELRDRGWQVSVNTVAKIMIDQGLVARPKRRRQGLTKQGKCAAAPDLVVGTSLPRHPIGCGAEI
jgi:hypothetical protein